MANQPTPLRAHSASDLSAVEGTLRDSLCYNRDKVDLKHFQLDESSECEKKKKFAAFLKAAMTEARDEKQLQDSVFTLLHDHHDSVYILKDSMRNQSELRNPKETKKEKERRKAAAEKRNTFLQGIKTNIVKKVPLLETLADKFVDTFAEVAERDTKTILDLYADGIEYMRTIDTKMKEGEHGIFIKTSSRPDIVAMIKDKKDILFAEIKNTENYSNEEAISQEICYLMLLLYWWRVVCARDVEKVRGFTVCGPRCSSNIEKKRGFWGEQQKYYHVSLIEMSIPKELGELNTATIWGDRFSIEDSTGINALYDFLSTDHLWNNVQNLNELTFPHCKAWMTLPEGFMKKCSDSSDWDLVEGGTSAVVVRCNGSSGLSSFVNSGIMTPRGSRQMKTNWRVLDEDSLDIYYVKVKTIATERPLALWTDVESFKDNGLEPDENDGWDRRTLKLHNEFLKAYPDRVSANAPQPSIFIRNLCQDFLYTYPFSPVSSNDFYAVVMNNRGRRRLDKSDSLQFVSEKLFTEKFWDLWRKTILFSLLFSFWHGDVAAFNIIVDDRTGDFILIDWDEAAKFPKSRLGNSLLCRMKHHETLRINSQQVYTDVQFALTYCQLRNERYGRNNWNVESNGLLKGFREAISSEDEKRVQTEAKTFVQRVKAQIYKKLE